MKNVRGYKVFNPDWTCRDMQYEVGKTYAIDGELQMCNNGFHFCTKPANCFSYYDFDSNNKVAEIEAVGKVLANSDDSKCVTDKIKIVREIDWHEVLDVVNTGNNNTGLGNSGDLNSGNRNSGYSNSGNSNSGNRNSGYRNSGDFNSCNYSSGVFCTETPKLLMFDKQTDMTLEDWRNSEPCNILRKLILTEWINEDDMTDEEIEQHEGYKTTGGYLRTYAYKEAWENLWNGLDVEEKDIIQRLPNFDKDKFYEITGIEIK